MFFKKKEDNWLELKGKTIVYVEGELCVLHGDAFIEYRHNPIKEGTVEDCLKDCVKISGQWHRKNRLEFWGVVSDCVK